MPFRYSLAFTAVTALVVGCGEQQRPNEEDIARAEHLHGVTMTDAERELMLDDIREQRAQYDELHQLDLPNELAPVLVFDPGFEIDDKGGKPQWSEPALDSIPDDQHYAYLSVAELGALLRAGYVTSVQLTEYFLTRIREHDDELHAVITITAERAFQQAQRADTELAAGIDRGPLHGIPYGLKDIAAVPGYPTTWGAKPYKEQVIDEIATVAKRMEAAGAVLVAKTAVGALAWGDVWFDAQTRTPWNTEKGASGSSAGSAAGVAAGYFPVAIGTETWGSIISPAFRNGVTGLRPTFGRVSRSGFMTLSWSMDKVGSLCRHVEDCGMVLDAIRGPDPADPTTVAAGFAYSPERTVSGLRLGYLSADFAADNYEQRSADEALLATLRENGMVLIPVALPSLPVEQTMGFILAAEAAAAFDTLTRSGRDDLLVRQQRFAWPNVLRSARFIPAVEYLQANRVRRLLIDGVERMFRDNSVDVVLAPCYSGSQLLATNLSGHPGLLLPTGIGEDGLPIGLCLIGRAFGEADLLVAAREIKRLAAIDVGVPARFR